MIKTKKITTDGKVHNKINVQANVSPTDNKFKESHQKENDDDNGWGFIMKMEKKWKENGDDYDWGTPS